VEEYAGSARASTSGATNQQGRISTATHEDVEAPASNDGGIYMPFVPCKSNERYTFMRIVRFYNPLRTSSILAIRTLLCCHHVTRKRRS
jgi:hypothetical protein